MLVHRNLRERAEKLAAAAAALKQASGAAAPFSLAFLTDRRRIANPEPILEALPAGAAVIYRDYDDPERERLAMRYAAICKTRGVLFLVAGDLALAQTVRADGVHWPARALRPFPVLHGRGVGGEGLSIGGQRPFQRLDGDGASPHGLSSLRHPPHPDPLPPKTGGEGEGRRAFLITASSHNDDEFRLAQGAGADLAFLGPVFPTKSHPNAEHLGAERFKALAAESPIPVLALGGVDEDSAASLRGRSVAGLGAIGAFVR